MNHDFSPILSHQQVSTGTQIHIDEGQGKLDLLAIDHRMKGEWVCIAENLAGIARASVHLEVGCKLLILSC